MSRPHAGESAFRAVADPTRRRIIEVLRKGDRTVIDLAESLKVRMPNLSHHLGILRSAGVVIDERRGRHRLYRLQPGPLRAAGQWFRPFGE